ncbi:putative quinol monooxygenase [Geodermatophilus sp. DSM 44513]|uniref:putative quinol monooxygenase n=1 Tax=Geodermatophilus sp. DSM 44513 TaxID=1528104 RepID=UPI00127164FF|nr:putative quinol monooxygenase [Geodermatophilus sp. DSM 44513]WNV73651.1 putative quinol monooxygenase [Geodermatophilus sp. DSM 44513]
MAHMRAEPGQEDRLREALTALVEPTSEEEGYVDYDLPESVEEPGLLFYENWETAAHLDAHLQTPHLVEFAGRLEELLDEQGLTITRLRRIA